MIIWEGPHEGGEGGEGGFHFAVRELGGTEEECTYGGSRVEQKGQMGVGDCFVVSPTCPGLWLGKQGHCGYGAHGSLRLQVTLSAKLLSYVG
jgi:hypothetical protein